MTLAQVFVSAMTLAAVAVAHPAALERRDLELNLTVTVTDSSVSEPTIGLQVAIYLDQKSVPTSTTTESILLVPTDYNNATTTTTLTSLTTVEVVAATATGEADVEARGLQLTVAAEASASAIPDLSGDPGYGRGKGEPSDSANSTDSLPGVSYAPYRGDGGCKTAADINNDFARLSGNYSLVRIYGTDCNQVSIIYEACKAHNMKLFLGIWDIDSVASEASIITSAIGSDWDIVDTVSVGNELVNSNQATAAEVISAVKQARTLLRKAGYTGPVVTVDTFVAVEKYPQLCDESDYCAINAHAYFDSTSTAAQAGSWLTKTVASVKSKLSSSSMKVVVTESGWPNAGANNGQAIAGLEQQAAAISSLKQAFADSPSSLILFSAFDDLWKVEADRHWGIGGAVSACDQ